MTRFDRQPRVATAVGRLLDHVSGSGDARVAEVRVYGSSVRGDWRPDSDVDLLVLVDSLDWRLAVSLQAPTVEALLEDGVDLSVRCVPEQAWRAMCASSHAFARAVEREGVVLWTRSSAAKSPPT
jgi:predicted nucleotidyltransferase